MFCSTWGTITSVSTYLNSYEFNREKFFTFINFYDQDIPPFDAGSHKSYINSCTFSGVYIIRLSQSLTIKVETDDGRHEMYLVLDFHFQNIVFYGDFMLMMS